MLPFYVEKAKKLAAEYGTRDPERIARELGIAVLRLRLRAVYGLAASFGRYKFIGVKSDLPEPAQKLVVAHELGHFILHPRRSFLFILTNTKFYSKHEYQANLFAAALVMEEFEVFVAIKKGATVVT